MKNIVLQISFTIGIIFFFVFIIYLLRKNALSLRYTLLWFFSIFVMLILNIFPTVLQVITGILGFQLASNAVFSLLFGFIIVILLSLTSIISKQSERIKTVAQNNALLEKRIRELEEKFGKKN